MKKYFKKLANCDFGPKKMGDIKAVAFNIEDPIGDGKYEETICQTTEWINGEGYDINFSNYNQKSGITKEKALSLSVTEIDLILSSLNELEHFNE